MFPRVTVGGLTLLFTTKIELLINKILVSNIERDNSIKSILYFVSIGGSSYLLRASLNSKKKKRGWPKTVVTVSSHQEFLTRVLVVIVVDPWAIFTFRSRKGITYFVRLSPQSLDIKFYKRSTNTTWGFRLPVTVPMNDYVGYSLQCLVILW